MNPLDKRTHMFSNLKKKYIVIKTDVRYMGKTTGKTKETKNN